MASEIEEAEVVMARQKRVDDSIVLLGLARTGRLDEPSAWSYDRRRSPEQRQLIAREDGKVALAAPPADIRVSANGAQAGAGSVNQDTIEPGPERQRA